MKNKEEMVNSNLMGKIHPTAKACGHSFAGRGKMAWWKCKKGHEWQASMYNRTNHRIDHRTGNRVKSKKNCPYCSNQKICANNCFAEKHPDLMKEWDYKKNKEMGIDPYSIGAGTHVKASWICLKCKEKWDAKIVYRTKLKGSGCPYCASIKISSKNNMQAIYPELAKEWDYEKNKLKPNEVFPFSEKKVAWICLICNNRWDATVGHRSGGQGCPKCCKVILKDNIECDSLIEAYFYLKYQKENLLFKHNKCYGGIMGKKRYDFYFPNTNTYVEVTSFNANHKTYKEYLEKIKKKKNYVENILKSNFEFIRTDLSHKQYKYVRENIIAKINKETK